MSSKNIVFILIMISLFYHDFIMFILSVFQRHIYATLSWYGQCSPSISFGRPLLLLPCTADFHPHYFQHVPPSLLQSLDIQSISNSGSCDGFAKWLGTAGSPIGNVLWTRPGTFIYLCPTALWVTLGWGKAKRRKTPKSNHPGPHCLVGYPWLGQG